MLSASIVELCYAFGIVLIICEFGQRCCSAFDGIIGIIDQFNWYSFPYEIQRLLPIILIMMQQPVALKCFGSISCNHENFKKVSLVQKNYNLDFVSS